MLRLRSTCLGHWIATDMMMMLDYRWPAKQKLTWNSWWNGSGRASRKAGALGCQLAVGVYSCSSTARQSWPINYDRLGSSCRLRSICRAVWTF